MSYNRPVIIGYDAVSPLGIDLTTQWAKACKGKSGIGKLTRIHLDKDFPVSIAGEVDDFDTSPYPFLSPRALANWTSPIYKYSMLVVHRAMVKSGLNITTNISPRVAVTFSSAVGGLDALLNADRRMIREDKLPHPFANSNSCINMVSGKISILTGATGPIVSTITACATGVTSLIMGAMFLNQGMADVAICGAVDFALVKPIVAGFATMNGAFRSDSLKNEESAKMASRPFSIDRKGFVISEGAGSIIIATKEFADSHDLKYTIELAGWSMTSDAKHFVAPNLDTVKECMAKCIENAGLTPGHIDTVNAHAASTKSGDKVESDALNDIFGDNMPPVTANKSLIGHAMGASSAIESIFSIQGMLNDIVPATINYKPDPKIPVNCVSDGPRNLRQEYVLKNSFGFGGCNSSVIFRRVE